MSTSRRALPWLLLVLALLVGASLRLHGLDWDAGQHLHPDERFITMRALDLRLDWPPDWHLLLDAERSPLNPRFFAYGSLTLYLLRATGHVAALWQPVLSGYDGLPLVGRTMSALFDLGSIALLYLLGARLAGPWVGLLAAWLVALAPFHIQVAHFWAADTPLTFFVLLALLAALSLARTGRPVGALGFGAALGAALAFKVSAAPLVLLALVAPVLAILAERDGDAIVGWRMLNEARLRAIAGRAALALGMAALIFVAAQPYVLLDGRTFLQHLAEQGAMARGIADLPYTRQYVGTTPYLYYLQNLVLWGFGPALGLAALAGSGYAVLRAWRRATVGDLLLLAWVLPYFAIVGGFHAKFMRYLLPVMPILALWAAWLLRDLAAGRVAGDGRRLVAAHRRPWSSLLRPLVPVALVLVPTALAALAFSAIYTRPHTRVAASDWIYRHVPPGSTLTAEHWDDPLPLARLVAGRPRSAAEYRIVSMDLYDPDDGRKLNHVVDNLLAADYVVLSSNRLYGSIPRSPERYPLTTRYYRLLFAGELGFAPIAVFTSYPTLFGQEIVDDTADESFTVYDHPKVLIFRKIQPLPREELVARLAPGLAGVGVPRLVLSPQALQAQRAGGTFTDLFPAEGLGNHAPLAVWLALVVLLGLLALPLATLAFARLADLGYAFARPLGLLLFAWLYWMGVSLGLLPGTRGGTIVALTLLTALGLAAAWLQRRALADLWRRRWPFLLVGEGAFWIVFGVFLLQRLANPDLWHPVHGGEKPMDLAYLTAVAKSSVFPPYDPWFAGGYLNYYYFGQVMLGTLLKLSGIAPAVAYNLAVPTIAGFAASAAASLGMALVGWELTSPSSPRREGEQSPGGRCGPGDARTLPPGQLGPLSSLRAASGAGGEASSRPAAFAGAAAAFFLLGIGNLGGAAQLWQMLWEVSGQPVRSTLPGVAGLLNGLWGLLLVVIGQRSLPPLPVDWYWPSTRIIEGTINEFPFFTFLYADLHAHVIAVPLFLSVAGLALHAALAPGPFAASPPGADASADGQGDEKAPAGSRAARVATSIVLGALLLGALWVTNAWDYPTGGALLALGTLTGWWTGRRTLADLGARLGYLAALAVLSLWLFRPFHSHFVSFYSGVVPHDERSPLTGYLAIHGLFLFLLFSLAAATLAARYRQTFWLRVLWLALNRWVRLPRFLALAGRLGHASPWTAEVLLAFGLLAALVGGLVLAGRHLVALLLPLLGLAILLLLGERADPRRAFVWGLLALGLTLGLMCELVRLDGDVGRMNTVFKFYFQVWALWAVASAAALVWLLSPAHAALASAPLRAGKEGRPETQVRSVAGSPAVVMVDGRPAAASRDLGTPSFDAERQPGDGRASRDRAASAPATTTSSFGPAAASGRGAAAVGTLWCTVLVLLVVASLVYPPIASRGKAAERFDPTLPPTLDGMAYMQTAVHREEGRTFALRSDWEAIRWLQQHVAGSPVVLEAQVPIYRWGSRVSIYTGLPTVLGWDWHQKQQRWGDQRLIDQRAADVRTMYVDPDPMRKLDLLRRYDVGYVYVGELERAIYPPAGLAAFEQLVGRGLERVYETAAVTIYRVVS